MKCQSCNCEIPPAFVNAIANNICPGCGDAIMDETGKELMDGLANALEKMPNDPQGIAGWLLSNFKITKIGEAAPVDKFHRKPEKQVQNNDGSSSNYSKFIGRTDYKQSPDMRQKLAKLKGKNIKDIANMVQDIDDFDEVENNGEIVNNRNDDMAYYNSILESADDAPLVNINSDYEGEGYMTPEEQELLRTPAGREVLNKDHFKRIKAQEAISSGGGAFKRG